jgi:hypothetical protein
VEFSHRIQIPQMARGLYRGQPIHSLYQFPHQPPQGDWEIEKRRQKLVERRQREGENEENERDRKREREWRWLLHAHTFRWLVGLLISYVISCPAGILCCWLVSWLILIVRYHCGGWPEEVNSCVLNSYMVYL